MSGSQIGGVIGGVIGFVWGGGNWQAGYAIGSAIGGAIDPDKIKVPGIKDLPTQTAGEGSYRQVVYGTSWINQTNIIDFGEVRRVKQRERQGKGGGPVVESERLYRTYAIGLGEPFEAVRMIRRNGKIVYDVRPGSTILADSAAFAERFTFYSGSETQLPDPDLEALPHNGVGNTPYYRGTAYMVFPNDDLTDDQGRIPTYEVEGVGSAVSIGVAWDAANTSSTAVLSESNTELGVVPTAATGIYANSRSNAKLTGNAYISGYVDGAAMSGAAAGFGISDSAEDWTDQTNWVGKSALSVGTWHVNGNVYTGGSIIGDAGGGLANGMSVEMAIRVSSRRVWIRENGGAWVGGGNPETDTSPTLTLGGSGDIYAVGTCSVDAPQLNRRVEIKGTAAVTTGDVPAGFTAAGYEPATTPADSAVLSAVVSDISDRCGIPSTQYDFSALTDEMLGVTLGGAYDGASTVALFFAPYSFDIAQPDKAMVAVKRGAAVVSTITADDFIEGPDESILRGQDIEYPRALMLKYLDAEQNYAAPAATVSRTTPDSRVNGEATMEMPISIARDEAFEIADKSLKVMWEDLNGEIEFSVPSGRFCGMVPTDCYGLSLRGGLYRIRITEVTETPWQLKVKARRDRQSAYTSALTGIPLPAPTPPPPALPGVTTFAVMDIPALVDEHDSLGVYVAVTGEPNSAWYGAAIEYSADGGANWVNAGAITYGARMGVLGAALPAAPAAYTDTTNTLAVELVTDDELDSLTQAQFLSEGNPAAICYGDGTAEIVQFRDADNTTGYEWGLTTMQRGRLGTSTVAHDAGEKFVMLEDATFVALSSALIGQTIRFRVTSLGTSPETAPTFDLEWNAVCQLELPPANLFLDLAGTDLNCTAVPRHRFGTEDAPIASLNFRGYRWTATDGANTATADTLDAAHTFDVTGWGSPVTVTVAQLNRYTGAGPSISEATA